jgi:hypothetical protein
VRKRTPGSYSRPGVFRRVSRFIRSLFSSDPGREEGDAEDGGLGVREPRRPLHPTRSGAVALEPPRAQAQDVWAVGEGDDR